MLKGLPSVHSHHLLDLPVAVFIPTSHSRLSELETSASLELDLRLNDPLLVTDLFWLTTSLSLSFSSIGWGLEFFA